MKQKYVMEFEVDCDKPDLRDYLQMNDIPKMSKELKYLIMTSPDTRDFLQQLLDRKDSRLLLWLAHFGIRRFLNQAAIELVEALGEKKI